MNLNSARANAGLSATASATSTGVSGSVEVGTFNNFVTLNGCDVAYALRGRLVSGANLVLVVAANTTTGSDAFVAGTAQVDTATASGTVTTSGNASITVTSAGMAGSPKTIPVPVVNGDTPTAWAAKVRTALAADADVGGRFAIGGATTAITLTRKPSSLGFLPATDATLNLAIANGTAGGITAAPTSADTTVGVASTGTLVSDGDGKDFEGLTLPPIVNLKAVWIRCASGAVTMTSTNEDGKLRAGEYRVVANDTASLADMLTTLSFNATADSDIYITVVGKSS